MFDFKKVLKAVLIIAGIICAAAAITAAVILICKKIKSAQIKQKKERAEIEENAYSDFEECCDACFSDSED